MIYFVIAAVLVTGACAWTDYKTGHMPNWLTLGALGLAFVGHFVSGYLLDGVRQGMVEMLYSFVGVVACVLVPGLMYWKRAIGGGDVKLFAALGAMLHPLVGLEVQTYAFFTAALIAPARLAYKGVLFKTLGNSMALVANPFRKKENRKEIPEEMLTWFRLGPCIFLGACVMAFSHWGGVP